ncbi:oligopeptide transporter, OPT family [Acetobacteraceae bacterium KSS8]|uniref:Oligopeptide transporter, OPT family n=1 Tax=Endosaccharibacter trunci TaxID=2812733 RepID=A0ABT1W936_9PROT|nr:oligopeptide transporter, OPT family [Acetobacteraceae bacterium KSS8]
MPIPARPIGPSTRELTVRGLILGALLTVIFTASNIYLGLKVGLTFASSIPAAVISMAVLRRFRGGLLENNMVQTQASAAGTLSSIIFVLPGLLMIGYWARFPFWPVVTICAAGGMLGVLFTIPLRRALVTGSTLPYPEGTAAAEVLRAGSADAAADGNATAGLRALVTGGLVSAGFSFCIGGLRVLGDSAAVTFSAGSAIFRLSTGFSLALVGAGYLVGIGGGLAMLLGAAISWLVAVPILTAHTPHPAGVDPASFAMGIWSHKVRLIGAGTIFVAAVWTLLGLAKPVASGLREALRARAPHVPGAVETDRDLSPRVIGLLAAVLLGCLLAAFAGFMLPAGGGAGAMLGVAAACVLFCAVFGFLVAAACGYMAGIVGSSSSPISGIAIVAVSLVSLVLLGLDAAGMLPAIFDANGRQLAIGSVLFVTSAVLAAATISNDNLQDLKTGQLVGATPWRQQVALLVGCVVGAAVIPPVLNLLYQAYGFSGALPRAGMDPSQALAAPQALLLSTLAKGIFLHQLDWSMILSGVALGALLVIADALMRRAGRSLPVLAVGIGLYLPPTVSVTLVIGAILSWLIQRSRHGASEDAHSGRGVMLASGFIVGESLMGVALAAIIGGTGSEQALAIVGPGFAGTAVTLGFLCFVAICAWFFRAAARR